MYFSLKKHALQLIIVYLSLIFVLRGLEQSLARLILIYDLFCKKDVRDIGERLMESPFLLDITE